MSEYQLCKALMDWVRIMENRYPCLAFFRHIPNEGKRSPRIAQAIGIKAGALDYQMLVPAYTPKGTLLHHGLCMEIKRKAKGVQPTLAQLQEIKWLNKHGYYAFWTNDLNDAIKLLEGYCKMVHHD